MPFSRRSIPTIWLRWPVLVARRRNPRSNADVATRRASAVRLDRNEHVGDAEGHEHEAERDDHDRRSAR